MLTIEQLDVTSTQVVGADLVDLLIDAVTSGASVGFLPPLARAEADAYWQGVFTDLAQGQLLMWTARVGDHTVGTVQLHPSPKANGRHRAEVAKLLVHSAHRRQGIGRALMAALEAEALRLGRTTLVLDTRQGDPSEHLYTGLGYIKAGVVPQYARSADGTLHTTAFFYKLLGT